jgi:hypothetical protein
LETNSGTAIQEADTEKFKSTNGSTKQTPTFQEKFLPKAKDVCEIFQVFKPTLYRMAETK